MPRIEDLRTIVAEETADAPTTLDLTSGDPQEFGEFAGVTIAELYSAAAS